MATFMPTTSEAYFKNVQIVEKRLIKDLEGMTLNDGFQQLKDIIGQATGHISLCK